MPNVGLRMKMRARLKHAIYSYVPGVKGRFRYFGETVYFPIGSHLFYRTCAAGVYEGATIDLIVRMMKPSTTLLDVGANIGLIAIPVLNRLPTCQVVSFEPSPNSLPYLSLTARESSFAKRWTIVGEMASDSSGESSFALSSEGDGAFDGALSTGRVPVAGVATVRKTTIDDEWARLGCPVVSVFKIDVEGAEKYVLEGARLCIEKCRPAIILEWNADNLRPYGVDPGELYRFAQEVHYSVYRMNDLCPATGAGDVALWVSLGEENFVLIPR